MQMKAHDMDAIFTQWVPYMNWYAWTTLKPPVPSLQKIFQFKCNFYFFLPQVLSDVCIQGNFCSYNSFQVYSLIYKNQSLLKSNFLRQQGTVVFLKWKKKKCICWIFSCRLFCIWCSGAWFPAQGLGHAIMMCKEMIDTIGKKKQNHYCWFLHFYCGRAFKASKWDKMRRERDWLGNLLTVHGHSSSSEGSHAAIAQL